MDKKVILFDLDGTLSDPKEGITKGVQYALRHVGIAVEDRTSLYRFIGPPLYQTLSTHFGIDEAQIADVFAKYNEYYGTQGFRENELYPGMRETLAALAARGKVLAVATYKMTAYAVEILKYFGIEQYFACISGNKPDGSIMDKAEIIRHTLLELGVTDLREAVMVGDRKHDILGAKQAGIASVGVLYGFGDYEELHVAGADVLIEDITELVDIIS